MADTSIEWADVVWNPSTGCDRVSPGCDHCYALTMAKRLKGMGSAKYQNDGNPGTSGPGFGLTTHDDALALPLSWRKPRRIFVNSMSDLFHDKVPDAFIADVFATMAVANWHIYQILTKRHGRMRALLNSDRFETAVGAALVRDYRDHPGGAPWTITKNIDSGLPRPQHWPLPGVWLGVSVEDQYWADIRVPALLQTPAAVRFLSCEPLLGPIDLTRWLNGGFGEVFPGAGDLHWVITGGESGPNWRVPGRDWFRTIRDQCNAAGVAYLHKQNGGRTPKSGGRLLDDVTHDGYPQAVTHA